ncbi:MAG: PAS domain-containing protein, partial [Gammaproteobacteria bacterium]|nr:PAS domain-containing protein [Gammaproteobacteria bacterium]
GVWDVDLIKNELVWDDWMFRLFDVEPKDFKGDIKDWERYVHPDDLDRVAEEAELAVCGEKDIDTDYRIVQPTGAVRHIKVFAVVVRDSDGHPIRITGTAQDITARKQAEEALQESEKLLREAQHIGNLGHWAWDRDADTLMWSDEVYRIFGVQPDSFPPSAEAFEGTIHPDDLEEFLSKREVMLREQHNAYIEHRIIRPDGGIRYVV